MSNEGIIQSRSFTLPFDNIDTDQIYPARYLTVTSRDGLGEYGFHDWRHQPGSDKRVFFEDLDTSQRGILVAGANFGCGSSREHAPWALLDMGFHAVISTGFGDIFYSNALKNGLLLVSVDQPALDFLYGHDGLALEIDIAAQSLSIPGYRTVRFPLDAFTAFCLANDIDAMDYLLKKGEQITAFETAHSDWT